MEKQSTSVEQMGIPLPTSVSNNSSSPNPKLYKSVQSFHASLPPNRCSCSRDSNLPCECRPPNLPNAKHVRPVLASRQLIIDNQNPNIHGGNQKTIGTMSSVKCGKAWVEVENTAKGGDQYLDYDRCMEKKVAAKAERLKEFQKEVKARVNRLEAEKKQGLLMQTHRNLELERLVTRKTAFLAQASMPNATDIMMKRNDQMIKRTDLYLPDSQGDEERNDDEIHRMIELERRYRQSARHKLRSRRIGAVQDENTSQNVLLPGGLWRQGVTMDFPAPEREDDTAAPSFSDEEDLPAVENHLAASLQIDDRKPRTRITADVMLSGVDEEEMRKQAIRQRALLRRLYMDIERAQVKDYKKMKEHNERIARIKSAAEEERKRQELRADIENLPKPAIIDLDQEKVIHKKKEQMKKEKEHDRYIRALRSLLKEKIERSGVDVPPLCSCGPTLWDAHPDLCANNCIFYKNPKAYERAMNALLTSCDSSWE